MLLQLKSNLQHWLPKARPIRTMIFCKILLPWYKAQFTMLKFIILISEFLLAHLTGPMNLMALIKISVAQNK